MRVMLIGSSWLGAAVLAELIKRGHSIAAVSAPHDQDRLYKAADGCGLEPIYYEGMRPCAEYEKPDLIVATHCHAYICRLTRSAAQYGAIGYHPSLLPLHRSRDAIAWAIRMHEPVTGGSVYWLGDRADDGPIAEQDWCFVRPDDTPATLWRRELAPMGVRLLGETVDHIEAGRVVRVDQDETLATWEPALKPVQLSNERRLKHV